MPRGSEQRNKRGFLIRKTGVALCAVLAAAALLQLEGKSAGAPISAAQPPAHSQTTQPQAANPIRHSDWQATQPAGLHPGHKIGSFSVITRPQSEQFIGGLRGIWGGALDDLTDRERHRAHLQNTLRDDLILGRDTQWRLPIDWDAAALRLADDTAAYTGDHLLDIINGRAEGLGFVRNVDVTYDVGLGGKRWNVGLSALGALRETSDDAIVWQLNSYIAQSDSAGGNGGLLYRRGMDILGHKALLGVNAFLDYEHSASRDTGFLRWSFGGEYRSGWGSFSANRYIAITGAERSPDGASLYTQSGWDAEARLHAPRIPRFPRLFGGESSLSGGLGYYLWEGEFGDADDEGARFFLALDQTLGHRIFHDIKIEIEREISTDISAISDDLVNGWGGKISFTHRFGAPLGGGRPPAIGPAFNPNDHFYTPVRREHTQRLRRSLQREATFLNPANGMGLSAQWNGTVQVNPALLSQPLVTLQAIGARQLPYVLSVSGNQNIPMDFRHSGASGTPATMHLSDPRAVSGTVPLTLALVASDSSTPLANAVTGTVSIALVGNRRSGNYHLISQNGINIGIVGHPTVTASYFPARLAEVRAFGASPPFAVTAEDAAGNVDFSFATVAEHEDDTRTEDLYLDTPLSAGQQATYIIDLTAENSADPAASATGPYTVAVVTPDDGTNNFNYLASGNISVWVAGPATVQVDSSDMEVARLSIHSEEPPALANIRASAGDYTLRVRPLGGNEYAIRLIDADITVPEFLSTAQMLIDLDISNSSSRVTGVHTVTLEHNTDTFGNTSGVIGDPNGFHFHAYGDPTVNIAQNEQELARLLARNGEQPYSFTVSAKDAASVQLAVTGEGAARAVRILNADSLSRGTLSVTVVLNANDSGNPVENAPVARDDSGRYTIVLVKNFLADGNLTAWITASAAVNVNSSRVQVAHVSVRSRGTPIVEAWTNDGYQLRAVAQGNGSYAINLIDANIPVPFDVSTIQLQITVRRGADRIEETHPVVLNHAAANLSENIGVIGPLNGFHFFAHGAGAVTISQRRQEVAQLFARNGVQPYTFNVAGQASGDELDLAPEGQGPMRDIILDVDSLPIGSHVITMMLSATDSDDPASRAPATGSGTYTVTLIKNFRTSGNLTARINASANVEVTSNRVQVADVSVRSSGTPTVEAWTNDGYELRAVRQSSGRYVINVVDANIDVPARYGTMQLNITVRRGSDRITTTHQVVLDHGADSVSDNIGVIGAYPNGFYFFVHGAETVTVSRNGDELARILTRNGAQPYRYESDSDISISFDIDGAHAMIRIMRIETLSYGTTNITLMLRARDSSSPVNNAPVNANDYGSYTLAIVNERSAAVAGFELNVTGDNPVIITAEEQNLARAFITGAVGNVTYTTPAASALGGITVTVDSSRMLRILNAGDLDPGATTLTITVGASDSAIPQPNTAQHVHIVTVINAYDDISLGANGDDTITVTSSAAVALATATASGGSGDYTYTSAASNIATLALDVNDSGVARITDLATLPAGTTTLTLTLTAEDANNDENTAQAVLTITLINAVAAINLDVDGTATVIVDANEIAVATINASGGSGNRSITIPDEVDGAALNLDGNVIQLTNGDALPYGTLRLTIPITVTDAANTANVTEAAHNVALVRPILAPDLGGGYDDSITLGSGDFIVVISVYSRVTVSLFQQELAAMVGLGSTNPYTFAAAVTSNANDILLAVVDNPPRQATAHLANSGQISGTMTLTLVFTITDSDTPDAATLTGTYTMRVIEEPPLGPDENPDYANDPGASVYIIGGSTGDTASARNNKQVLSGSPESASDRDLGNWETLVTSLSDITDRPTGNGYEYNEVSGGSDRAGNAPAAVTYKKRIYVAGIGNDKVISSPDGETWTDVATGMSAKTDLGLQVLKNRLLLFGGDTGSADSGEVWTSADGETWHPVPQVPGKAFPANAAFASAVHNGTLYMAGGGIGGAVPGGGDSTGGEIWATTDGSSWTKVANLHFDGDFQPIGDHAQLVSFDDELHLFMNNAETAHFVSGGESFDLLTHIFYFTSDQGGADWSNAGFPPGAYDQINGSGSAGGNAGGGAAFILRGRLYFTGGVHSDDGTIGSLQSKGFHRGASGNWDSSNTDLPAARAFHAAVVFKPE